MTLRILHLTDAHLFHNPAEELKGVCTRKTFERVVAAIEPEISRADRLIVTGDLAHDDLPETYPAYRELLRAWWSKVRIVPGNHDVRSGFQAHFSDRITLAGDRIVFQDLLGGWRLMGLDSHWPGEVRGALGALQLDWLDRELGVASTTPTALFLHHPPVVSGSPWMNAVGLTDVDAFWSVLARHPQVRVITAGHVHHELSYFHRGVLCLTTPSTGVQFVPESEVLQIDTVAPGYRVLELETEGTLRTRVVRVP